MLALSPNFLIAERRAIKIAFRQRTTLKLPQNPSICTTRIESCGNLISNTAVSFALPQKFIFGVHGRPRLEQTAERMLECGCLLAFACPESHFIKILDFLCDSQCHSSINSTSITDIADILPLSVSQQSEQEVSVSFDILSELPEPPPLAFFVFRRITKHLECFLSSDWRDWSFKWRIDGFFLFKANNWWSIGCCDWSYWEVISYRARGEQENISMRAIKKEIERRFPIKSLSSLDWRKQIDWIISPATLVVVAWTLRRLVIEAVGNFSEKSFKLCSWLKRETLNGNRINVLRAWAAS